MHTSIRCRGDSVLSLYHCFVILFPKALTHYQIMYTQIVTRLALKSTKLNISVNMDYYFVHYQQIWKLNCIKQISIWQNLITTKNTVLLVNCFQRIHPKTMKQTRESNCVCVHASMHTLMDANMYAYKWVSESTHHCRPVCLFLSRCALKYVIRSTLKRWPSDPGHGSVVFC